MNIKIVFRRSGYSLDQTKRILINGIKNYEARRKKRIEQFGCMRRTAVVSSSVRRRTKLTGKTTWFKGRKNAPKYRKEGRRNDSEKAKLEERSVEVKTVLFVDYTKEGALASSLREVLKRMEGTLGFIVKVVERNGISLRNQFPLGNLWEGTGCGRGGCVTCTQETEFTVDCTRPSVLYENVCHECNPEAEMKAPLEKVRQDVPSIYVGESSRSIFERGVEHWKDWEGRKGTSHILKHQEEAHSLNEDPKFTMRVVRSYRSALARQVGEAVRIRRRGGEGRILNSKAEYSRCVIPRLTLERIDEEELDKMENEELEAKKKQMEAELSEW